MANIFAGTKDITLFHLHLSFRNFYRAKATVTMSWLWLGRWAPSSFWHQSKYCRLSVILTGLSA